MSGKEVTPAWVAAFNARNVDQLADLYDIVAVNHQVAAGGPVHGRDAILTDSRQFFAAFPDNYTNVESLHEAGEWTILEWSGGATWLGPFAGRDPNGKKFALRGCGFFLIVDGKIKYQRGYWDRAGWFLQLGLPL